MGNFPSQMEFTMYPIYYTYIFLHTVQYGEYFIHKMRPSVNDYMQYIDLKMLCVYGRDPNIDIHVFDTQKLYSMLSHIHSFIEYGVVKYIILSTGEFNVEQVNKFIT